MIFDTLCRRALEDPQFPLSGSNIEAAFSGAPNAAGVKVNRLTAMGQPALFRAVDLKTDMVAKLPVSVFRKQASGGKVVDENHPAQPIVSARANENLPFPSLVKTLSGNCMLHGSGFAFIQRDGARLPRHLFWLDPERTFPTVVTVLSDQGRVIRETIVYSSYSNGEWHKYDPLDVLHIRGLGHSPLEPYSVIDLLRESLGLGIATRKFASVYFRNNARPNIVIEMPSYFKDEEAVERFRNSWGTIHQGVENSHRPAILENGAKVSTFGINAEDAQLLDSRKFSLVDIANITGVFAEFLGADINTSYNSLEARNKAFLNYSLTGLLSGWQCELELKLLSEAEKTAMSHIITQDKSQLEQPDRKTEAEAAATDINNGILLVDEERARRNLAPLPDGAGAAPRMPLNIGIAGADPVDPTEPSENPAPDDGRLSLLVDALARRMVERVARDANGASKKPSNWLNWLDGFILKHRSVLIESFSQITSDAEGIADAYLTSVHSEMLELAGQVNADQLSAVVSQLMTRRRVDDPSQLCSQLLPEVEQWNAE